MKKEIKAYFEQLNPKQLDLKNPVKVLSISKLPSGASNLNFLVKTNGGKFIFRMNIDSKYPEKSKKEYFALKVVEKYKIGPKAHILDESKKKFDNNFIILSYIEGVLSSRVKPYLDKKKIKKLARLMVKIHSIKLNKKMKTLDHHEVDYLAIIKSFDKYKKYIFKNTKSKILLKMINEMLVRFKREYSGKKSRSRFVLDHGDFHKENLIVNNGRYYLIDFEDLEINNQASSLALFFVDFKYAIFTNKEQKIFLDEYKKYIKTSKELEEEIKDYIPLKILEVFLWSIEFTLKYKNKEMPKEFKSNHEENVNYSNLCFKQALKSGVIDKKYKSFDIKRLLK